MAVLDPKRTLPYQEKVLIKTPPENLLPTPLPGINLRVDKKRNLKTRRRERCDIF